MIITIKGATYTYNIGALDSWFISRSIGSGATYDGVTSVKKGESFSATVTIKEGYEIGSAGITVTMGGEDITDTAVLTRDEVIVISIAEVTGNVFINVSTKNIATGEEDEPETPVTPTNYTFTINPTPSTATVTLTASGYTQNGNSITVPNGTSVSWSVSADDYITRRGTWTANGENKTENVVLNSGDISEYAIYDSFDRAPITNSSGTVDGLGSTDTGEEWVYLNATTTDAIPDNDVAQLKLVEYKGQHLVKGYLEAVYPSALVPATDLDRHVEMTLYKNHTASQFILYDKYLDATNYVGLVKTSTGTLAIRKKVDGINTDVAKTTETYNADNTVFAIRCVGNEHIAFVNGTEVLRTTIADHSSATNVGFSINGSSMMATDFKVAYL